jgi:hypothetical protein
VDAQTRPTLPPSVQRPGILRCRRGCPGRNPRRPPARARLHRADTGGRSCLRRRSPPAPSALFTTSLSPLRSTASHTGSGTASRSSRVSRPSFASSRSRGVSATVRQRPPLSETCRGVLTSSGPCGSLRSRWRCRIRDRSSRHSRGVGSRSRVLHRSGCSGWLAVGVVQRKPEPIEIRKQLRLAKEFRR